MLLTIKFSFQSVNIFCYRLIVESYLNWFWASCFNGVYLVKQLFDCLVFGISFEHAVSCVSVNQSHQFDNMTLDLLYQMIKHVKIANTR